MRELSNVFGELVRMLKDLPPGGFDKAYAHRPVATSAAEPVRFMCDKQHFKDVVRMAEWGASLAEEAHVRSAPTPDPFVETVLAGMKSLEAKVDQLSLDTANLAAKQQTPPKTFAAAAAGGKPTDPIVGKTKAAAKGKKPPPAPQAPRLTLSQVAADKADFVEIMTDAGTLASRATRALSFALEEQATATTSPFRAPTLRGITRNAFTGDIHLHLNSQESLKSILALSSDTWVMAINPGLCLKRRVYPVIVHGIPTTFNPGSRSHVRDLIDENHGVLDTATKFVWANKHSIELGKPFSSLIIHLTDPIAANNAITNRVCFKHILKVTEKSTKRIRQCYTCLDFGHYAKTCSEKLRACSHCAGNHRYETCTKMTEPVRCVNCIHHTLDTDFADKPEANIYDLSDAQRALCAHSVFSNQCPLRRIQVAKHAHLSDVYEIPSHE